MSFVKCSKCGRTFHDCSVQKCSHKTVNKKFGPNICMYCCRPCTHNIREGAAQACKLKRKLKAQAQEQIHTNLENYKEKDTLNGN